MGRPAHPWRRKPSGDWYAKVQGRQVKLVPASASQNEAKAELDRLKAPVQPIKLGLKVRARHDTGAILDALNTAPTFSRRQDTDRGIRADLPFPGRTVHERAVRRHVNNLIVTDPSVAPFLGTCLGDMLTGFYPKPFIDAVFQKPEDGPDIYDAYVFSQVVGRMALKELALLVISVGETPRKDREVEANNAILSRLAFPFVASFVGETKGDDDGYLAWAEPTLFGVESEDDPTGGETVVIQPARVPLEVGTTRSSRTFTHLAENGGIARWPYGSDYIHVLVDVRMMSTRNIG